MRRSRFFATLNIATLMLVACFFVAGYPAKAAPVDPGAEIPTDNAVTPNPQTNTGTTNGGNTTTNGSTTTSGTAPAIQPVSDKNGLVQCGNDANNPCTVEDVFNFFVIATNFLIGMAGIVAIIVIIISGFRMALAAGNESGITSAKKQLTYAIIGLLLTFGAFIIINAILYGTLGIGVFGGEGILGQNQKPGAPANYVNTTPGQ